jgi:hypothetical protein
LQGGTFARSWKSAPKRVLRQPPMIPRGWSASVT